MAVSVLPILMSTPSLYAQGDGVRSPAREHFSDPVSKVNPGFKINTQFDETKPIVSLDGQRIYFARKHSPMNVGGLYDPQDIYFSETTDGIHWTTAQNAGKEINTNYADNLCGILGDGRFVFYVVSGKNRGQFVVRGYHGNRNSPLQTIGPVVLNESEYLEGFVSADGQTILYTAKTKQNFHYRKDVDERDIYISRRGTRGWSDPVNIGSQVNSPGDEFSPFLSADGRTLYFASDGRGGYGQADIFVSRRLGNGWTNWTTPENLGPEINTEKFDGYFSAGSKLGIGYIVSRSNSIGKTDIITVTIPERFRPLPSISYRLKVEDRHSGESLSAKISIFQNGNLATEGVTAHDGTLVLMAGDAAVSQVQVFAEGYEWFEGNVGPDYVDRHIVRLTRGYGKPEQKCGNVLFEKGTSTFVATSQRMLDSVVTVLNSNPSIAVELRGHTDDSGTFLALKKLSEKRVAAVSSYLQSKGIRKQRISGMGLGSSQPVCGNDTEDNKKKNRRVEIIIRQSQLDL